MNRGPPRSTRTAQLFPDTTLFRSETLRYYERIGLLPAPDRTAANYRSYTGAHRSRLSFVRHSRELGFTIEEIRSLLDLSDDPARDCGEADRIATAHLEQIGSAHV